MSSKHFVYLFALLLAVQACFAQDTIGPDARTTSAINKKRMALMGGVAVGGLAASYIYVQKVWWSDQKTSFHVDHDMDYRYAKNMDKVAHFIGGSMSAELFKAGFYWAGMNAKSSYLYAGALGSLMQGIIELKDGFAPTYGFSVGDVVAGTAGSFLPYLKYNFPKLHSCQIKLSYFVHDTYYYDVYPYGDRIDDYMNQTYWLSVTVDQWLPRGSRVERIWPDWLCVVGGFGVDNTLNMYYTGVNLDENKGKGNYEYYLSVDIDWRKIIKPRSNFNKALADALNYIKLPLPTLRLAPTLEGHWMFL